MKIIRETVKVIMLSVCGAGLMLILFMLLSMAGLDIVGISGLMGA